MMKYIKFNKTLCGVDFLLNVIEIREEKANKIPKMVHAADFFQIIFVRNGKGTLMLNNQRITSVKGSILFISQHQKHQWISNEEHFHIQVLVFQEDFLNEYFSDKYFTFRLLYFYQTQFSLRLQLVEPLFDGLLTKLNEIKAELCNTKSDSVHLIRSVLYYVLILLNREYAKSNNIKTAIALNNIAYQFRKLVEEHICAKQRIEDYTELMKISRISLNKAVKEQFNVTASDFIKARLLQEVKALLIFSNLSIAEIANKLHFSEPNHLTRFFKTREGQNPTQFKIDYQNGSH
ncbi:AraC family transcriptional regulator [Flammeovirgaceae bacterium SG7u.111]|nr:AraC family transcriptional regulator [Flammeovirgaceae bacterium SG7u.132]WPO34995.1 AraC family transcriptional regulator [Flammeovirgaceae bacterium SG7u.111]